MGDASAIFVNDLNLGMATALWLATDQYDHNQGEAEGIDGPIVSATTLLKPTRSLILSSRVKYGSDKGREVPLSSLGSSRIGQAVHTAMEQAFFNPKRDELLEQLGFSKGMIKKLVLNPDPDNIPEGAISVFLEKRAFRQVRLKSGIVITISGKFDQVVAGSVEDNKVTKAYSYMKMDQSEKSNYAKQQSIYRWLNPKIITSDMGKINFIFTDWKQGDVSRIKGYPPNQVMEMPVNLLSVEDTEAMIIDKLDELEEQSLLNEPDLILCSDEELWRAPDVHKYYANPAVAKKNGRSTKNFDTLLEAQNFKTTKGKGVVKTIPGEVKRCGYCDGAPLCSQRMGFL